MKKAIQNTFAWAVAAGSIALILGLLVRTTAFAQVATSTETETASTTPAVDTLSSASTTVTTAAATVNTDDQSVASSTTSSAPPTLPTQPPPQELTLVHIIGTKYTDYFTDGTSVTAYPGDAAIDANLDKSDAPTPARAGLMWVHTTGQYLYDTESGDLDVGDYAVDPKTGSNIENSLPSTFVSSTSTPANIAGDDISATTTSNVTATASSTPIMDGSTNTSTTTPSPPPRSDAASSTTATTTSA